MVGAGRIRTCRPSCSQKAGALTSELRALRSLTAPTEIALLILNHFRIFKNCKTPPERAKYPSTVTKP